MAKGKEYQSRRAELLAQLFLQEIGASIWNARGDEAPFDYIAVFLTEDKKLRLSAIEIKATERLVGSEFRFPARPEAINALRHSNVPVLFLVVDVKHNEVFYGWASEIRTETSPAKPQQVVRCILPVSSAKEGKKDLLRTILSQPEFAEHAAVG